MSSEFGDTVNYLTQSSVIGLNDFANYPQVDFGASEIGYSTGQADPRRRPTSIPVPTRHRRSDLSRLQRDQHGRIPITSLKLNSQVLAGIFSGTITEWDDPAIAALNPGVLLPHNSIVVVFRSDASGDNFIFSDYLETEQPGLWNAFTSARQLAERGGGDLAPAAIRTAIRGPVQLRQLDERKRLGHRFGLRVRQPEYHHLCRNGLCAAAPRPLRRGPQCRAVPTSRRPSLRTRSPCRTTCSRATSSRT